MSLQAFIPKAFIFSDKLHIRFEVEFGNKNFILFNKSQNINIGEYNSKIMKEIIIYTDGACKGNPGPGGYGAVLIYKNSRKEISGGFRKTTNNRMELLASIKALSILKQACSVELYTDSKYIANAINKNWLKSWKINNWITSKKEPVKNKDLWTELDLLLSKHKVIFNWVKGHANNKENEICDVLASNEAAKKNNSEIDFEYEKLLK